MIGRPYVSYENKVAKILSLLARDDAWLEREGDPTLVASGLLVFVSGKRYRGEKLPVSMLKLWLSRGWIEKKGSRYILSEAGCAYLRRIEGGADGFRAQHQVREEKVIEVATGIKRSVTKNLGDNPLGWLRTRKDKNGVPLITDKQFEAGERFSRDFYAAQLCPNITSNWSMFSSSKRRRRGAPEGPGAMSAKALDAKARVEAALNSVGPELCGILLDVCCFSEGLELAEKKAGWPQRSGKVVLRLALSCLARHYGYISEHEAGTPIRRRMEHWGTEDYRPEIE